MKDYSSIDFETRQRETQTFKTWLDWFIKKFDIPLNEKIANDTDVVIQDYFDMILNSYPMQDSARAYLQAVATNGRDDLIQFVKKHAWVYIGTGILNHEKGYRN